MISAVCVSSHFRFITLYSLTSLTHTQFSCVRIHIQLFFIVMIIFMLFFFCVVYFFLLLLVYSPYLYCNVVIVVIAMVVGFFSPLKPSMFGAFGMVVVVVFLISFAVFHFYRCLGIV